MVEIIQIDEHFEDWQSLLALVLKAFDYMHPLIDPPSSALKLTPEALKAKAHEEIGYAAMIDGALVGCLFCRLHEPETLYLGKVAVLPDMQGQGIGRAMLKAAEGVAHACGVRVLELETRIELDHNHRRFEKWGFQTIAKKSHPGYDHATYVTMQKRLN
ncbi:GNAT family N-acetyltransferase [Allorhizobium sp. BGMRC 0089]|uniref:GNAT family N-acetyltransferase n=1 Tax=Allorhizobium sonneratiae TaxID=2934936 RepID=UPI002033D6CB|nr:GNAT family N-acetyltransferase [Allorhizobium sonneratiae]MCM2291652.1 GNAT family N-acetyltransferase [Allorhizobium sonneratiae]